MLADLTQEDLGQRMTALGHEWSAGIVGFVERGDRAVTVDELVGLAMAFEVSPGDLLDPAGPDLRGRDGLDVGAPDVLPAAFASQWLRQRGQLQVDWDTDGTPTRIVHSISNPTATDEYFKLIGDISAPTEGDQR